MDSTSLRLGVLISGTGSNLQALIDAIESKKLANVEIALVVSNKANAYGLQRALTHNLPVVYLPWKERAESEARLAALAGCVSSVQASLNNSRDASSIFIPPLSPTTAQATHIPRVMAHRSPSSGDSTW